jgi:prepilin signal peptidase PulO-like enzyme (type II secretory pathway)
LYVKVNAVTQHGRIGCRASTFLLKLFLGLVRVRAMAFSPAIALGTPIALLAIDELDLALSSLRRG